MALNPQLAPVVHKGFTFVHEPSTLFKGLGWWKLGNHHNAIVVRDADYDWSGFDPDRSQCQYQTFGRGFAQLDAAITANIQIARAC